MEKNLLEKTTDPLPHRLASALSKVSVSLKRRLWRDAASRRISPLQAQILAFLRQRSTHGATVSDITRMLGVTMPTASDVIAVLVKRGLLRKFRTEADGRVFTVLLTARGRRRAEQVQGWPDFLLWAAELLPPEEQESLLRTLVKLIRSIQERGEIPAAKMCVTCTHFRPYVNQDSERPYHCALMNADFGDRLIRIDCNEHEPASPEQQERQWQAFINRTPIS
ncbi:MAG: MarR family transcriptional regulator [Nitrospiraceae bacterium]|nr:MarR family transcriptional regulator [Nitrospiraceae bacterium]MSR23977.1 MarR family transcriptional regulator [Nitrospiraceae bacterium]